MSSQQANPTVETLTEAAVESYLRQNPDFFERHQQLLISLNIKHPQIGTAVSLIERQALALREKNASLEKKLMELVNIARENEQLGRQLQSFASELLKARTLSDVIAVTQDKIRDFFQTDFVVLRLLDTLTDDQQLAMEQDLYNDLFKQLIDNDKPICGRLRSEQVNYLFEANAENMGSAALVPLKSGEALGLLALASKDEHRFNPGQGHMFLSYLGELVTSALVAHLYYKGEDV